MTPDGLCPLHSLSSKGTLGMGAVCPLGTELSKHCREPCRGATALEGKNCAGSHPLLSLAFVCQG